MERLGPQLVVCTCGLWAKPSWYWIRPSISELQSPCNLSVVFKARNTVVGIKFRRMEEKVEISDQDITQALCDSNASNASLSSTLFYTPISTTVTKSSRRNHVRWPTSKDYLQISPLTNRMWRITDRPVLGLINLCSLRPRLQQFMNSKKPSRISNPSGRTQPCSI